MTNEDKRQSKHYLLFLETFPKLVEIMQKKYNIENVYQFENDFDFVDGIWPDAKKESQPPRNDLILCLFHNFIEGFFAAKSDQKDVATYLREKFALSLAEDYKIIIK